MWLCTCVVVHPCAYLYVYDITSRRTYFLTINVCALSFPVAHLFYCNYIYWSTCLQRMTIYLFTRYLYTRDWLRFTLHMPAFISALFYASSFIAHDVQYIGLLRHHYIVYSIQYIGLLWDHYIVHSIQYIGLLWHHYILYSIQYVGLLWHHYILYSTQHIGPLWHHCSQPT